MPNTDENAVEAFENWCEKLAARKARNAVPGEPAPPLVNAVLVSGLQLIDAFQIAHPEYADSRGDLEAIVKDYGPGLEVDKERWNSLTSG